uniref:CRAL-TRIO domain-containing protein n=1 Tax=Globodera rostochiensis TaxID=31243 RepID=A0A914HH95_GLORO
MSATEQISFDDMAKVQRLREMVKEQLSPYYDTNFNLLRWLRGHNDNFGEIVPKLKNHLLLRRLFHLDSMADGPRDHQVHKHWEAGLTSESGLIPDCLVNIEQSGTNDYWGMLHTFPINHVLRARIYDLEVMLRGVMAKEEATGRQHSVLYVMDLSGLKYDRNLITLLRGALSSISAFMSEHYVELIHAFVLVNAPNFISTIWSIAKPLLPERTRNKVQILGKSTWRSEILQMARAEALPSFWNAEGEENLFLADVKRSVPIDPANYHKTNQLPRDFYTAISIGAGKCGTIEVEAEKGQTLRWKFESDGHFCFAVHFKSGETPSRLAYPKLNQIPGPTFVPFDDHLQCDATGVYQFWFSNEHAWLHALKIRHRISKE